MPGSEPLREELGRLLRTAQAEQRLPSVVAAVFRGSEVVWTDAAGAANVEGGEEATPDHQYRIGSITKTFTAAAVMQLRDAGELELDDRLGDHVPESPLARPTLRRLLSHLSGLQREPPGEIWETMEPPDREQLLASLERAEQVLPPGAEWHYSNLAFALLGEVVARRSGTAYVDYVRGRLLEPLRMTRTTWHAAPPVAQGYLVDPFAERVHPEPYDVDLRGVASAGGLWSTVGDLCRWGAFLAAPDRAVLAPETVEEMRGLQAMKDPERWTIGWGLGLGLYRSGERVWAGHGGAMPGHLAALVFSARAKLGAAVLSSSGAGRDPTDLALELAEAALGSPAAQEPWRAGEAVPAELEGVLGRWWSEGYEFLFTFRDGRLHARHLAVPEYRAVSVFERDAEDRYRVVSGRERGELLRIVRDEGGRAVKLYWATYPFLRDPRPFGT